WTLFRFLNPGLLGSREQFGRNYAIPIEKNQDSVALDRLRRIVRPFILRRLKAQVLTELPPRTEIEISVELPPQSRAFYEALRRDSLERLAELKGTPGQTQIQILAEITKLRLACCSPQLVNPDTTLQSAKMPAFLEIVDELRENGHRALVFSQFVKHLTLLRGVLDRQGVSYQYLDGSTPAKARAARVTAFQEGNGDLFLISLKAGGTGLNLTAADYVVHMDPWWNPAVEDQASDRAHRIGQERPVTIYRIVARDTIEDRIIALHREKRKLVDGLLADTAMPKAVSAEELIALLREDM
ncbi:MAG: DEAD/DEAH box helicase, partial [Lentisphaeria bacterium]|nr:DEAD/DEAH box helicase [Lentisphaeria bacterium]